MAPISRSTVTIRFYGPDLDPEMLSQLLGNAATSSGKKGDIQTNAEGESSVIREGFWLLHYGDSDSVDLEEKIDLLLGRLTTDLEIWQEITNSNEGEVFCGLFLDGWHEGFELSPVLLSKLAERNLRIGFDVYSPTDSWYNDGETNP